MLHSRSELVGRRTCSKILRIYTKLFSGPFRMTLVSI